MPVIIIIRNAKIFNYNSLSPKKSKNLKLKKKVPEPEIFIQPFRKEFETISEESTGMLDMRFPVINGSEKILETHNTIQ